MHFKRYDVYLANLDPTIGQEICKTRPVAIVSPDELNAALGTVVVCPLTTTLHPKWRTRVQVLCKGKKSEVALDQIRTLRKIRLIKKLDTLPPSKAEEIRLGLTALYGESY